MSIDTSIVRIRTPDRLVVGAGFLVDHQHIFTCAHVVTQALGLPEETTDAPSADIWLDFPLVAPKKLLTAKVVRWHPRQEDESGDLAVLQVQGDLPEGVEAVCFAEAEDVWNHPFRAFGFPQGQDDGVWATGRLLGRQATNWIMMEDVKTQGFAVIQGFSGGPVWDIQLQGVVGMVVASVRSMTVDTKTAFVIPLDVLANVWETESPAMSQRVFLSSAPGDATFTRQLCIDLCARGIVVWNEQQGPDGIPANEEERLRQAIRSTQALVLVVSPQTRASRTVQEHLRLANLYRRRLILLWVGDDPDARPHRYGWRETTWIDVHQVSYPSALETVETSLSQDRLTSITALLGPNNDVAQPEPRNPYKGLRAFTPDDTRDFFGRDRLVNELLQEAQGLLATPQAVPPQERLLTLIGPSGSGKSSVLMAGLLPRLRCGAFPGSEQWIYLEPMVPGKHPLEALALALKPYFPESSIKTLREDLEDDATRGLHLLATQLAPRRETKVVLLVDQFEELFTQTESEAERCQFIGVLLTAATEPRGPILVLLTLRADFYDRPMYYPELSRAIQAHLRQLLPMDVEDLRATIEQPAAQPDVRLTFEGNLVGDLLFEVQGQVGALPLLQFTLEQLFQRRSGHRLTLQAYREIGGVRGALSQHAEKTYTNLPSDEHRKLARALFLRLIEPGATEQDTTRRRAVLTEFEFEDATQTRTMHETLDAFVAARLLTTNETFEVKTVEVSHEAVIREWSRLATWLHEAREDIPLQQAVSGDVAEWEQRGKPRDRLYRGTQLKEARAWANRNLVSEKEQAFLRASASQRLRSMVTVIMLILLVAASSGIAGWFVLHQPPNPSYVTNINDDGEGSLRWANTNARVGDTITFDPRLTGKTIDLKNNLAITRKKLKLQGLGKEQLSIACSNGNRFIVDSGALVSISHVAFKGCMLEISEGNLTLTDSIVSGANNTCGILNADTLSLINSTVSGNFADGNGGGIVNGGTASLINSTVSGNSNLGTGDSNLGKGGGIYNGDTLSLTNSTVSNNSADYGGGINNFGTVSLINSTVSGNSATRGGGIDNEGTVSLINSTVSGNSATQGQGGGIFNIDTLSLTNSTVSGNSAPKSGGGGIMNGKILSMINSTVSGNSAAYGGGMRMPFHTGFTVSAVMRFCTIYDNLATQGANGIWIDQAIDSTHVHIQASIVTGKLADTGSVIAGRFTSDDYNVIQNLGQSNFKQAPHDQSLSGDDLSKVFNAQERLQKNGGPTATYKLLSSPGNPAIDAIPLDICHVKDIFDKGRQKYTDQRGMSRPGGKKQRCDIGAYESSG